VVLIRPGPNDEVEMAHIIAFPDRPLGPASVYGLFRFLKKLPNGLELFPDCVEIELHPGPATGTVQARPALTELGHSLLENQAALALLLHPETVKG
jgi:hypothetical protein